MGSDDGAGLVVIGALLLVFVLCGGSCSQGYVAGIQRGKLTTRTEAVEAGVGEWVPKSDGTTEFRWKVKE